MKIGELARETGVSVRLLRYYEERELLTSHRAPGGHRHYTADASTTVAQIRALLAAGLPTKVIRDLMPCLIGDGPEVAPCVLDHLRTQLDALDTRITHLHQARSALSTLLTTSTHAAQPASGGVLGLGNERSEESYGMRGNLF